MFAEFRERVLLTSRWAPLLRQYLYFCTSKASNLSWAPTWNTHNTHALVIAYSSIVEQGRRLVNTTLVSMHANPNAKGSNIYYSTANKLLHIEFEEKGSIIYSVSVYSLHTIWYVLARKHRCTRVPPESPCFTSTKVLETSQHARACASPNRSSVVFLLHMMLNVMKSVLAV